MSGFLGLGRGDIIPEMLVWYIARPVFMFVFVGEWQSVVAVCFDPFTEFS